MIRHVVLSTALALSAAPGGLAPAPEPTPAALSRLQALRVREMGVDRAGNLWAWSSGLGLVTLISPQGIDLGQLRAAGALTVDMDAEWGAVGIFQDGYELRWLKEDGEPRVAIWLGGPASDVCWIGPETVAVSPQTAGHRIEIWSLKDKARVKTLGEETPLHPGPGATRMRTVLLRHDFSRGLLFSLESFTGDLQVFAPDGRLAWRGAVENPRRPAVERWLQEMGAAAKARNDVQTPAVYTLRLALSPQGEAWTLQSLDETNRTATLVRTGQNGSSSHVLPAGNCPSYDLVIWGSHFLSFREPESPKGACVGEIPHSIGR